MATIDSLPPLSPVIEDDYSLNDNSVLTIEHLISNQLYEDYIWMREIFSAYAKTQEKKPYHSSFFVSFIQEIFYKKGSNLVPDVKDKKRILNFIKKSAIANIQITDTLLDDSKMVGFTRTKPSMVPNEEFPTIKKLKGVERLAKAYLTESSLTVDRPLINIGSGELNKIPDSTSCDIIKGEDVNSIPLPVIGVSSFVSLQSIYHIRPSMMHVLLQRPFLSTYTFIHDGLFEDNFSIVSCRVGRRQVSSEFNYHPDFFSKRGSFTYALEHFPTHSPPLTTVITSNIVKPPKRIFKKESLDVHYTLSPYVDKQQKIMIQNLEDVDPILISMTDFYQTEKLDGIFGKLLYSSKDKRYIFHSRHGTSYFLDFLHFNTSSAYFVEVLLDEKTMSMKIYVVCKFKGSYLWEDIESFQKDFPTLGVRDYYLVPRKRLFKLPISGIPSDGVVYIPVLYSSSDFCIDMKKINVFSHFFFKPLPTFDVSYEFVKDLLRRGEKVLVYDVHVKCDNKYYQAKGDFVYNNPFVYEVSVEVVGDKKTFYVHHLRLDKKKIQDMHVAKSFKLKTEEQEKLIEKGIYFYTKYADNFEASKERFFSSFNKDRRSRLPLPMQDRDSFYASVLSHIVNEKMPYYTLSLTDLYAFLLRFYPSDSVLAFISMALKSYAVTKTYGLMGRMDKVSCVLTFHYSPDSYFSDISWLFEEPSFTKPMK